MAVDVDRLREAYVRIVPTETAGNAIIGPLNKRAEVVCDPATGKEAHLLEREVVVGAEMRSSTALLSGLGMGIGWGLEHYGKRRSCPITTAQCVATQLEAAAERCQLQKSRIAGRTRLAGLACIERN